MSHYLILIVKLNIIIKNPNINNSREFRLKVLNYYLFSHHSKPQNVSEQSNWYKCVIYNHTHILLLSAIVKCTLVSVQGSVTSND